VSDWVRTARDAKTVGADGAAALEAARTPPGSIATLIVPADAAWNTGGEIARVRPDAARHRVDAERVAEAARALSAGAASTLLLGGAGLRGRALELAGRISAKTGCRLLSESNNARAERGAGRVQVDRVPYVVDRALAMLESVRHMVLAGARAPVAFFAYPGKPSVLLPGGCAVTRLAGVEEDIEHALEALVAELGALSTAPAGVAPLLRAPLPRGAVSLEGIGAVIGALLPENAIVIDESVSTGRNFFALTAASPPHDWINIMGGSIGFGLPAAVGAAIAAPGRKVIALEGDGSAMYTQQALWTMARERLDVTVVIFANRAYQILRGELASVGAGTPGTRATGMLTLDRPDPDWVSLARGYGVEAGRASDLDEFARQLQHGLDNPGPYLVELLM
jgi:acetolactate synthase-1/2/3 large subunit